MKKLSMVFLLGIIFSFSDNQDEKKYILTEGQVILLSNAMAMSKQILPTSQAPAIQVTQLNATFDSIQSVLIKQYQNFHPDTTKKK